MLHADFFGRTRYGQDVHRYWLENENLRVAILDYGATVQDVRLKGIAHSLILGSDEFGNYEDSMAYFGAIVGRVAGRIGGGTIRIDGIDYQLDLNTLGRHTLHGGHLGSSTQLWTVDSFDATRIELRLALADGHMGFPGNMTVLATYELIEPSTLKLTLEASTDRPGPCSFAQHSYHNLSGQPDILNHRLSIQADRYLELDDEQIPTGQSLPVQDSRLDFTMARTLRNGPPHRSLDHGFCLSRGNMPLRSVASLYAPDDSVCLYLHTTEAGLQLYDGVHIDVPSRKTHGGQKYGRHAGLALECQAWPDALKYPAFPSVMLRPGETYRQETCWQYERLPAFRPV